MSNFIDQIREIEKARLELQKALTTAKKTGKKNKDRDALIASAEEDYTKYMLSSQAQLVILKKKMANSLGINKAKFRDESKGYEDAEKMHKLQQEGQMKIVERFKKNIGVFTEEIAYIDGVIDPTKKPKEEVVKEE